MDGSEQF